MRRASEDDVNEYAHIPAPPPPPPPPPPAFAAAATPYVAPAPASRHRLRRSSVAIAGVMALGATVFGVAAVAQRDDSAARSPMAAAIEGTQAQETARVDITVDAPGLSSPIVTSAAVDFKAGASRITLDLSALAGLGESSSELGSAVGSGPVEVLTKGTVAYVKMGGLGELLGGKAKWIKIDASKMASAGTPATGALGDTPDTAALLELLEQQADSFTEVGPESVRGVDTTRYSAVIDLARVVRENAAQLDDPSLGDARDKLDQLEASTVTVDVWVDADDVVRKVVISTPTAEGTATITVELYDFGAPVDVAIPDEADTIDITAIIGNR